MTYLEEREAAPWRIPSGSAVHHLIDEMREAEVGRISGTHKVPCLIGEHALHPMIAAKVKELPRWCKHTAGRLAIDAAQVSDGGLRIALSVSEPGELIGPPVCKPQSLSRGALDAALYEMGHARLTCDIGPAAADGGRSFQLLGEDPAIGAVEPLEVTGQTAKLMLGAVRWAIYPDMPALPLQRGDS
jgi:hypothetical protein